MLSLPNSSGNKLGVIIVQALSRLVRMYDLIRSLRFSPIVDIFGDFRYNSLMPEHFFKPFPEITWDRDYVEKPNKADLPTRDETTLFDPVEKLVLRRNDLLSIVEQGKLVLPLAGQGTPRLANAFDALGSWLTAPKSDDRRRTKKSLEKFMDTEDGAKDIAAIIELQPPINPYLAQIAELNSDLERTTKPPSYFRITGIFRRHILETSEELEDFKHHLRTATRETFRPGDNNIYFMEDASGILHSNDAFPLGYKRYNSLKKAMVFFTLNGANDPNITLSFNVKSIDDSVQQNVELLDTELKPKTDPAEAYLWTQMQVIDEFIQEGYQIQIMFEKPSGTYSDLNYSDLRKEFETITREEFDIKRKKLDLMLTERVSKSNEVIAAQLIQLDELANPKIKTNVLMVFGTAHAEAIDHLPERLRQVTTRSFSAKKYLP